MGERPGEELSHDAFLGGRLTLAQPLHGYRAGTDAVFLAAACPAAPGDSVLDLGCGVGTAALCLGTRVMDLRLAGLELQPAYAALARRNAAAADLPLEVVEGDLAAMPAALRGRSFDHVITNPPFFAASDPAAPDPGRATARQLGPVPLADWIAAALRRLRPGGGLTAIAPAERLADLLAPLNGSAGDIAVLPLASRVGRPAGRVIVRARKGARGPLRLAAPLIVHQGPAHLADGDDFSPEATAILRDGAPIVF
ncbi:MAG: methyltransferase [Pseudomonadota bacterium]